jgi:uncharacterized protein (DUF1778 family)
MSNKNVRISLRVTPELWALMEQIMQKEGRRSINDFVQACIHAYIDEIGDIIGSRRHFNKSLATRMDHLEALLLWNSLQAQVVTARGMFTVMDELAPEDASEEPPTPDLQLTQAVETGRRLLPQFLQEQTTIVSELEQFRRKQAREKSKQ